MKSQLRNVSFIFLIALILFSLLMLAVSRNEENNLPSASAEIVNADFGQQSLWQPSSAFDVNDLLPNRNSNSAKPDQAERAKILEEYSRQPIYFEPNVGQVETEKVKFIARGTGYNFFISNTEARFALRVPTTSAKQPSSNSGESKTANETEFKQSVIQMQIVDANPESAVSAPEKLAAKSNYFIGSDPSKWRTDVPNYGRVRFAEVYAGVDLEYYGNQKELEYDFIVKPQAAPDKIKLRFDGVEKLSVNKQGELVLKTEAGEVRQKKPIIYQEENGKRQTIEGGYQVKGREVGFWLGEYDEGKSLTIDPILNYSASFIGGGGIDYARDVSSYKKRYSTSSNPAGYFTEGYTITGITASANFPVTNGAFQTAFSGNNDVFIRTVSQRFDVSGPSGNFFYTTYLGGTDYDAGYGVAMDANANVWVTGETYSSNFPTSTDGRQRIYGGNGDAFIARLNPQGNQLLYSTFHGGSSSDYGFDLRTENANFNDPNTPAFPVRVWLTGGTVSSNFPTTNNSYGGGANDAFVTYLNLAASPFETNSRYLGGSGDDVGRGISVTSTSQFSAPDVYIAGSTSSANFPITAGAYQTVYGGGASDAFITKVDIFNSLLPVRSTYLGKAGNDSANAIDFPYITGSTSSANFPTVSGAFQTVYGGGANDAFYTVLNFDFASLSASTFLGGNGDDIAYGVAQVGNDAYITGTTASANFPTTADGIQRIIGGGKDAFIAKSNSGALGYSTFYGGSGDDAGNAIAAGIFAVPQDNVLVVGDTTSANFPTTQGAGEQTIYGGGSRDGFFITTVLPTVDITVRPSGGTSSAIPNRVYAINENNSQTYEGTPLATGGFSIPVPPGNNYTVFAAGGQRSDGNSISWTASTLQNVTTNQTVFLYVASSDPQHSGENHRVIECRRRYGNGE